MIGELAVGTQVQALFDDDLNYYPGLIAGISKEGKYRIEYDDGDIRDDVPRQDIKVNADTLLKVEDSMASLLDGILAQPTPKPAINDESAHVTNTAKTDINDDDIVITPEGKDRDQNSFSVATPPKEKATILDKTVIIEPCLPAPVLLEGSVFHENEAYMRGELECNIVPSEIIFAPHVVAHNPPPQLPCSPKTDPLDMLRPKPVATRRQAPSRRKSRPTSAAATNRATQSVSSKVLPDISFGHFSFDGIKRWLDEQNAKPELQEDLCAITSSTPAIPVVENRDESTPPGSFLPILTAVSSNAQTTDELQHILGAARPPSAHSSRRPRPTSANSTRRQSISRPKSAKSRPQTRRGRRPTTPSGLAPTKSRRDLKLLEEGFDLRFNRLDLKSTLQRRYAAVRYYS